jgi:D-cysteine desulfhydrase/L-cysteate sulfo-lyase
LEDGVVGQGYGLPTPEIAEAVRLVASQEGLVLDPVYTGKAMAGLIAGVRAGYYQSGDVVIFLHTGGTPGLFEYPDSFPVRSGMIAWTRCDRAPAPHLRRRRARRQGRVIVRRSRL